MKNHLVAIAVLGLFTGCRQAEAPKELKTVKREKTELKTEKDRVSYSLGMNLGNSWKKNEADVDLDTVVQGIKDALTGQQTLISEPDAQAILAVYTKDVLARNEEKRKQTAEKNWREAILFLGANRTNNPGVVMLDTGLQYKVITNGDGVTPELHDFAVVNLRGTLLDGTEFENTYKRGQPAVLPVKAVIPGLREALQLMKVGSKWQLFIHPELAYSDIGCPNNPLVGPNTALIYELELLEVRSSGGIPRTPPITTRGIFKVPSMDDLKNGAKIEAIEPEQIRQETEKEKTP